MKIIKQRKRKITGLDQPKIKMSPRQQNIATLKRILSYKYPGSTVAVLLLFLQKHYAKDNFQVSYPEICEATQYGRSMVAEALKTLRRDGWLSVESLPSKEPVKYKFHIKPKSGKTD